jgi:hypothetical protein
MDILLILGSVTAKQYEPLRLAMLQQGRRPKIVRITKPRRSSGLFSKLLKEWESKNGTLNEENEDDIVDFSEWSEQRTDELLATIIKEAFNDSSTKEVKALLYPKDATIGDDWFWITRSIPDTTPCYQVVKSENDDTEYLEGYGFGRTFDIKK